VTVGLYDEAPGVVVPRAVAARLAASSELASFFGARIFGSTFEEAMAPILEPTLACVMRGEEDQLRQTGGGIRLVYVVGVSAFLPAPTPAVGWLTVPAAPTLASATAGALTGSYDYRLTELMTDGESFSSARLTLSLTSQSPTLTMPAASSGSLGWRLWRSKAGLTACRWCATVPPGTATVTDTVADSALGDELAPVKGMREQLGNVIRAALYGTDNEILPLDGHYRSAGALRVTVEEPRYAGRRNLMVYGLTARYFAYYNPEAGSLEIDV